MSSNYKGHQVLRIAPGFVLRDSGTGIVVICGVRDCRIRMSSRDSKGIGSGVFIGPTVDGGDKEFVKVVGGKVDRRNPSFA